MSEGGHLPDKVTFHWRSKRKRKIHLTEKPIKKGSRQNSNEKTKKKKAIIKSLLIIAKW